MQDTKTRIKSADAVKQTLESRQFAVFKLHEQPLVAIRAEGLWKHTTLKQHHDGSWYEVDSLYSWAVFNAVFQGFEDLAHCIDPTRPCRG